MKPEITQKKLLNTESWDDFLDFSRWRVPPVWKVLPKRITDNFLRFSGNYLLIWLVLTISYGLFLSWRLLASLAIIAAGYRLASHLYQTACLLEARDGRIGASKRLEKDVSLPLSAKGWLSLFAVFLLYEFGVLLQILLTFLGTLFLAGVHALARPVVNEYYFVQQIKTKAQEEVQHEKKRPSVVHSDGYKEYQQEEDDEVVIDFSSDQNTLRNRNIASKSHS